jgi:hypothetical protein
MKAGTVPPSHEAPGSASAPEDPRRTEAVLQELDRILTSRFFRSAGRSRQFLQFVVRHKLEGHAELLKERTIGTEVFERPPDYSTGEDPVVRVQAGEVRRRLEQYYHATPGSSPVTIELTVGSYSPIFRWKSDEVPSDASPAIIPIPSEEPPKSGRWARGWAVVAICALVALVAVVGFVHFRRELNKKSTIEQFWNPVFDTQQPVLICLAKPVVYRPSSELYERYARAHPGTFQTEVQRYNEPLPLDPNEKLTWGNMAVYSEYGVALGDAYAGVSLSGLLGKLGKPSQVRIGSNYSFEDLRNSPAIVVGAFNNRWTMHLTENLHFAFVEKDGQFMIQEQIPGGRAWRQNTKNGTGEPVDYAIVARLLNSKTGQFTVAVAGISGTGTQAAGDFVSNPEFLQDGLRDVPKDWQKRNMELILQTAITDSVAGPPHVVAVYYW